MKYIYKKVIFILCCISFLLPWLSHNPRMCGYVWGFQYAPFFALPMLALGISVFSKKKSRFKKLAGLTASALNPILCIAVLGKFNEFTNVKAGWELDFDNAFAGFWISATLMLFMLALECAELFRKNQRENC